MVDETNGCYGCRGTKYEFMAQFRHRRDEEIGKSIVRFIREHPGMRIALVMGANHHVFAVETIEENFGKGEVLLVRG